MGSASKPTERAPRQRAEPSASLRVDLSAQQTAAINQLPARVASQARQLLEKGWFAFARTELHAGRNPACKGWKKVFCQMLLDNTASRVGLQLAFVEQLELSLGSAKMQVSSGASVFLAGGIIAERQSKFYISQ